MNRQKPMSQCTEEFLRVVFDPKEGLVEKIISMLLEGPRGTISTSPTKSIKMYFYTFGCVLYFLHYLMSRKNRLIPIVIGYPSL